MKNVTTLIVDEAAQATEVDTLIPFQHFPRKCLLVGDTKQLPAVVTSGLAKRCHLDWSMMHRLVEELHYPHHMLDTQYRMHADIRKWPSMQFYANKLQDGDNIPGRANLGLAKEFEPYSFINVNGEERSKNNSFVNQTEANAIVQLLKHLKVKGINIAEQVGIITFYAGQVDYLNETFKNNKISDVRAQTVDGFQGDEKDIIIISFVRSNKRKSVGFINDFRRLNVAITRPKHSLIMLGNRATLKGDAGIKALLDYANSKRAVHEFSQIQEKYWPVIKPVVKQQLKVTPVPNAPQVSTAKPIMQRSESTPAPSVPQPSTRAVTPILTQAATAAVKQKVRPPAPPAPQTTAKPAVARPAL